MFIATPEIIAGYHKNQSNRHAFYTEAVELYEGLECHFEGEAPKKLIKGRRPAESENVWNYRDEIFQSMPKPILSRVFNSLQKIRKSPDWVVKFDRNYPSRIADQESPERYLNYNLPLYGSITNWAFNYLLRPYLMDANGFVAVQPFQMIVPDVTEYTKPVPVIYDADDIMDQVFGQHLVAKSNEKVQIKLKNGTKEGSVYYVYTTTVIQRWVEDGSKAGFVLDREYVHNLGVVPVHQTFGVVIDSNMNGVLAESRLQPMVPSLNEMAREYSDLQAEIVQHIHSTPWYYAAVDCTACKGSGQIPVENSAPARCDSCGGSGKKKIQFNSYEAIVLPPPQPGDTTGLPTPPAGYIQKDTTIAELQDKRVDAHGYKALAAMNMQFLDASPLNQSGLAKEVDRDELQNTVHSIAEDIVRICDFVCQTTVDMRYGFIVADREARKQLYPVIPVPDKFDLLTTNVQVESLQKLSSAGVDKGIIKAAQIDLVNKMFNSSAETKNRIILEMELDPLNGFKADEITTAQTFGAVSDIDAVIHFKIGAFIDRAMQEDKTFASKTRPEQMQVLVKYAQEQIAQAQPQPNNDGSATT